MQGISEAPAQATRFAGLAADDTGGDDRPPLVLLHGLTFDRRLWAPIVQRVQALDPTRRVVTLDLPGHGGSDPQLPHDFEHLLGVLEKAFDAAAIDEPVLVGHSMSGGLASLFGARHRLTAIVNVDQPPDIGPFARLIQSLQPRLRGPDFPETWQIFADSFHADLLPPDMRSLVETNCSPVQERVLSYWSYLFDRSVDDLVAEVGAAVEAVGARRTPYLLLLGSPLQPEIEAGLRARVPQIEIADWSPSGHFPHLAHPDRFAELLVSVGR
jgi:pimeloyl-ACP methyl ester carboxylesterase